MSKESCLFMNMGVYSIATIEIAITESVNGTAIRQQSRSQREYRNQATER